MADDAYVRRGLNSSAMAVYAHSKRQEFGIWTNEFVDIVALLEFTIPKLYAGFKLVILRDEDLSEDAVMVSAENCIKVRESIYCSACEGVPKSRLMLAHELGHYLLHRETAGTLHSSRFGYRRPIADVSAVESAEDQADMFARHFLAPPYLSCKYIGREKDLADRAGVPLGIAKGNITMSKRQEMRKLVSFDLC